MSDHRLDEIAQANEAVPRLHPSPADVEYLLERVRTAEQRVRVLRELAMIFVIETKDGLETCLNCKRVVGFVASASAFELAQSGIPSRDREHEPWCPLRDGETP